MEEKALKKRDQRGGLLIEAALWMGFFALMIPMMVDVYFLSNTYLSLDQITRQAVVTEMEYPNTLPAFEKTTLEETPPDMSQQVAELHECTDGTIYKLGPAGFTPDCAHKFIKWRIRRLIESHKLRILPENIQVTTTLNTEGLMHVKLVTSFDSFTYFLKGKRITNVSTAHFIGG